jgi:HPt (histidine-containing phosphotransfer) domain-containing protein
LNHFPKPIRQLGTGGLAELLAAYREESAAYLALLQGQATGAEDMTRAAHSLKSSSGNLGVTKLQWLCAALEKELRAGGVVDLAGKVDSIAAARAEALKWLDAALSPE